MSTIFEEQNDLLSSFSTDETMSPVILVPDSLKVVKASFTECVSTNWETRLFIHVAKMGMFMF